MPTKSKAKQTEKSITRKPAEKTVEKPKPVVESKHEPPVEPLPAVEQHRAEQPEPDVSALPVGVDGEPMPPPEPREMADARGFSHRVPPDPDTMRAREASARGISLNQLDAEEHPDMHT